MTDVEAVAQLHTPMTFHMGQLKQMLFILSCLQKQPSFNKLLSHVYFSGRNGSILMSSSPVYEIRLVLQTDPRVLQTVEMGSVKVRLFSFS